jgi:hypothetical protein
MITDEIQSNPWLALPKQAPYILPEDAEVIAACGSKADGLRLDILPDPYVGSPSTSRVVFLALNPGFRDADLDVDMQSALYVQQTRANLLHEATTPFYFFNEGLAFNGGNVWWSRILKPLTVAGITKRQLGEQVMCIEYLPYHSKKYKRLGRLLPSQEYTFQLVREAIKAHKVIVMMRSEKIWLEAIPELSSYGYMMVKNPQNPVISVANLGQDNFNLLYETLAVASGSG